MLCPLNYHASLLLATSGCHLVPQVFLYPLTQNYKTSSCDNIMFHYEMYQSVKRLPYKYVCIYHVMVIFSLQAMLLDSSLQLPPPVLVIHSPSDVLLVGISMESPSGEWVRAVSVPYYTLHLTPILVELAVFSQL